MDGRGRPVRGESGVGESALTARIAARARHVGQALPLAIYLMALPEFHDLATPSLASRFGRRFAPISLGQIDDADLHQALQPFTADNWPIGGPDGPIRVVASSRPDAAGRPRAR